MNYYRAKAKKIIISLRFLILVIINIIKDKLRTYSIRILVVIFLDSLIIISNNVKEFLDSRIIFLINIILK